jgi:hypothetical protein
MQTLDVHRPGMPDLQFVLIVTALCTSGLKTLNIPEPVRVAIFDRCWSLLHESPPPTRMEDRVLDLRQGNELTLEAMVVVIRSLLNEGGIRVITWDHPPSETTHTSTPEALPLIERLQKLYPKPPAGPSRKDSGP